MFATASNTLTNSFNGDVSYLLSQQTNLRFYGGYDLTRYEENPNNNSNGFRAGFRLEHRPTPRLTVTTGFEHQDYRFDNQFESSKVERLTVGFGYALRPTVNVYAAAGPELSNIPGKNRIQGYFLGGVQKTTRTTRFGLQYQQGTAYERGLATGLFTRTVFGSFSHRFTEKLRLGLSAGYVNNEYLASTTSHINGFQGGPTLEYAIRPDLTFVASYYYLKQTSDSLVIITPSLSHHFATIGFEYRIPRLFHR